MLRLQLPERSAFRFGRKNNIRDDKDQVAAPDDVDTELKLSPHVPLPMVHHTSTKSLFDLFTDESAYSTESMENYNATPNPRVLKSMPEDTQKPATQTTPISPFDALGSHGDPTAMAAPTASLVVLPRLETDHEFSAASSTPSSGFRIEDDASGCSRKSSTSSIGTPLAGHKAYFEATAAADKETGLVEESQLEGEPLQSPQSHMTTQVRSAPQYDKPLPAPPSPERPFSVSSVLSIMRADSVPQNNQQPSLQMMADAPVIFRRLSQVRPGHGRSTSDGILRSKSSKTFKAKSPSSSPRSKRGARLGTAMSQGRPHSRAQTLSSIKFLHPSAPRPEKPRPLSLVVDTDQIQTIPEQDGAEDSEVIREAIIAISPSAAENVVFQILRRLDEPADILAAAAVNRGFYGTFKRGEQKLVDELLLKQCSPAWEFQKNTSQASGEPLSFRAFAKDKTALTYIKSALLTFGASTMKLETRAGLVGTDIVRRARIDAALWRIWTFCKGFGPRSLSEEDLAIQVDWLNGGRIARKRQIKTAVGRGNGAGVSTTDLEDLLEMWDSLGAMLLGSKLTISDARATGLFERCGIDQLHNEEWFLEEWFHYIRSLGLPTVLSVSSATSFEDAHAAGLTEWTPPAHGQTRSSFFRMAVTSVYQERLLSEAATKATQFALPPRPQHRPTASDASISSLEQLTRALAKHAAKPAGLKINTSPSQVRRKPLGPAPFVDVQKANSTWQPETPDAPFPAQPAERRQSSVDLASQDAERDAQRDIMISPIRNSVMLQSLGMTATASTKLGATLFPMEYPPTTPQTPVFPNMNTLGHHSSPRLPAPAVDDELAVIDPVDKAMKLLTQDMGFSTAEASRALAKCDTGFGIDVQKAIEMLAYESGRNLSAPPAPRAKTPAPSSPVKASTPAKPHTSHNERTSSAGSGTPAAAAEPLCDTYPVRQPSLLGNLNRQSFRGLSRMTSKAKAFKVLGVDKSNKAGRVLGEDVDRPPRLSSLRGYVGETERPLSQSLPAGQLPVAKMPPLLPPPSRRKAEGSGSKLMGIDEEPSHKAMRVLGVDEVEIRDRRISPASGIGGGGDGDGPVAAMTTAVTGKARAARRLYEGRFGNLGWSDAGLVKG